MVSNGEGTHTRLHWLRYGDSSLCCSNPAAIPATLPACSSGALKPSAQWWKGSQMFVLRLGLFEVERLAGGWYVRLGSWQWCSLSGAGWERIE